MLTFAVELLTRCCTLVADVIVLVATWMKTFRVWREARGLEMAVSVSGMLLRDGEWGRLASFRED